MNKEIRKRQTPSYAAPTISSLNKRVERRDFNLLQDLGVKRFRSQPVRLLQHQPQVDVEEKPQQDTGFPIPILVSPSPAEVVVPQYTGFPIPILVSPSPADVIVPSWLNNDLENFMLEVLSQNCSSVEFESHLLEAKKMFPFPRKNQTTCADGKNNINNNENIYNKNNSNNSNNNNKKNKKYRKTKKTKKNKKNDQRDAADANAAAADDAADDAGADAGADDADDDDDEAVVVPEPKFKSRRPRPVSVVYDELTDWHIKNHIMWHFSLVK